MKTFEHAAVQFSGKLAIIDDRFVSLTYEELNNSANILAHTLIDQGVKKSKAVAINLERSANTLIAIYAILKTGAAFLPIDPNYPTERIEFMIDDAKADFIITSKKYASDLKHTSGILIIEDILSNSNPQQNTTNPVTDISPDDIAYLLYTSGSTGQPKAAMVTHKNIDHFLHGMQQVFSITPADRFLSVSSTSFDASCFDNFLSLTKGATLVIASPKTAVDGAALLNLVKKENITISLATPVTFRLMLQAGWDEKLPMKVLSAGEPLAPSLAKELIPKCTKLFNVYGPTETTVICVLTEITDPDDISIGHPIEGTPIYILNEQGQKVANGESGEIFIGGDGVSKGYWNREELTKEKFLTDPFSSHSKAIMYKSGDLGRWRTDGKIDYLGRTDGQVKIRGFRIELGEIENKLNSLNNVTNAVVVAKENKYGDKNLVAYLTTDKKHQVNEIYQIATWRKSLSEFLPAFMVPDFFVIINQFPISPNGKVDRKALPDPSGKRPNLPVLFKNPETTLQKMLCEVLSEVLLIDKVGVDDNFFELGGNSLKAQTVVSILKNNHAIALPVTKLYQYPTVVGMEGFLEDTPTVASKPLQKPTLLPSPDIAIIGMECNFPGAGTIEELWGLLKNGKETVTFFKESEIDPSVPEHVKNDPTYVKARGVLEGVENFDAALFGISPNLAELMDPQHRQFLELSRNVLEKTGYLKKSKTTIGVFAGCNTNTYFNKNVIWHQNKIDIQGAFPVTSVTDKDYIASRVSYQLNLTGPAINVNSACSTGLLAVVQAVESIRSGQCNIAIAGAAAIHVPVASGHLYAEGAMLSADGHTKAFDAEAKGTVFSDGAGAILLKSLEEAEKDGDTIYAVIKGIGVGNDGGGKGSFSAPSAEGQANAILMAIKDAGIKSMDISYIEAHGTATPLGDPIEIEGLKLAFGDTPRKQYCKIGSIKSNFGHLTHAAGVAGLIKAALALHHKQLPPSINFNSPNPLIRFEETPFAVQDKLEEWNHPERIAGVSSFGVGGTNVHVVVKEYTSKKEEAPLEASGPQIITWSARSKAGVGLYAEKLRKYLSYTDASLTDISYTLLKTRQEFNSRISLVADSRDELSGLLNDAKLIDAATVELIESGKPLVFMFPGQGSQYINMGRGLYESESVFKDAVDECAGILKPLIHEDIREIIYKDHETETDTERLKNTFYTQPAIFITSYALAKLLMSYGIRPDALVGHSVGEFVAAHLSGIMSLTDALTIVSNRAQLISNLPSGSMLSVQLPIKEIEKIIPDNISIAAINAPGLLVVSGTHKDVDAFSLRLSEREIEHRKLMTSHAFHSSMMDPILKPLQAAVERANLQIPKIPILSTVTGSWLKDEEAASPVYWAHHSRATVNFSDAILKIEEDLHPLFIEVGPGTTATILAKRHSGQIVSRAFNSIDLKTKVADEPASVKKLIGRLWQNGVAIDIGALFKTYKPKIIHELPTYAYNKKRYWLEAPSVSPTIANSQEPANFSTLPDYNNISSNEMNTPSNRKDFFIGKVKEILENTSGIDVSDTNPLNNFMEIGLDSLMLTQIAAGLKKEFQLPITFRMLNEDLDSIDKLADYLSENSSLQIPASQQSLPVLQNGHHPATAQVQPPPATATDPLAQIAEQINLLSRQISLLQGGVAPLVNPQQQNQQIKQPDTSLKQTAIQNAEDSLTTEEKTEIKKPFGAIARIETKSEGITGEQKAFLEQLITDYSKKTAKSKAYTQQHRSYMADPRVVSGFKPATKEMIYSLVMNRSKGCHLWDIDGNEYVDALSGFGSNFLGYQPDILKNAMLDQIEKGYEIGPQHELAGEVSKLICEITGAERVGLCNTGSEAVLGAMRIARTVNNRNLIVAFTGSYHGIVDEVLVRGTKKLKTFPAASGILHGNVQNMLILDYGTNDTLEIIKSRANEIAGILVEPVQSRRPEFQPVEFLQQLREITLEKDIALIFDEVITGFRCHPAGAQGYFGIQADLAIYGKVVGGGLSIGVIGGKKKYLDALDGGFWQYGDSSVPEVGVTYFAGTFVRHPLTLATAKATLQYLKEQGPQLQAEMNRQTEEFVSRMNEVCEELGVPIYVARFSSLWKIKFKEEYPYHELLFALMRMKKIHIWDGFPCFVTTAHTNEDLSCILAEFKSSLQSLLSVGFIPKPKVVEEPIDYTIIDASRPPVPGARLGRDKNGNPAWFVKDSGGKYLQLN